MKIFQLLTNEFKIISFANFDKLMFLQFRLK